MFCAKCGTKLDDGAAFCHICGERQIPLTQKPQQNTEVEKTMGVFSPATPVSVPPVQTNQDAPVQNVSGSVEKTMGVFSQDPVSQVPQNQGGEIIYIKPGTILHGRYTVGEVLGNGGFGITYIGQDNTLQMKVAIKEFFPRALVTRNNTISENVECINSQELFANEKSKVIKEARILAKFAKTPGIVNVLEYFEENNTAYIVMEYIEGGTLKETIKRNGLMTPDYAFAALTPIMQVVGQLHRENVIHRDISPDNIMFDGNQPKLLDFGAAREILGETGDGLSVILKHGYAPQEQYSRKGNQGTWTDVYSLCATIYYCITGKTPDSALDRIHNDELIRPSQLGVRITPAQENALMQGLSIFPANRLQTIDQFMSAWNAAGVQAYNNQTNYMQSQMMNASKPQKQKKNKTGLILGIIGGAVALLILIIIIASSIGGKSSTNTKPNTTNENTASVTAGKLQEYLDQANKLAEDEKYDEAIAVLDTAEQLLGKNNQITSAKHSIMKTQGLSRIDSFEKESDYEGGIKYINSELIELKNDSDIVSKLNLFKKKYKEQLFEKAENAFKSSGYKEAISILETGLKTLTNDSEINNKIAYYKEYEPVSLSKLKLMGSFPQNYQFKEFTDPRGNVVSNAVIIGDNEYFTEGKYSHFSCTLDPVDDFPTNYDFGVVKVEIYADDKLVYTSGEITYKTDDLKIEANINNAQYIRFEVIDISKNRDSMFASLTNGVFIYNAYVSK